jgi:hypothetical protein
MSLRSAVTAACVGVAAAAVTGIALGAIPDSGGTVHACYQTVKGATKPVRLLDTGQKKTCPAGWAAVTWSQVGPRGSQGLPGPPGPSGATVSHHELVGGPVTVPFGQSAPIPISDPAFTAPADAIVAFYGTFDAPNAASCDTGQSISVSLNGTPQFNINLGSFATGPLSQYGPFFLTPNSDHPQTITATLTNACPQHLDAVLNSLTMNVSVIG